jgi:hypothetical protein
MTNHNSHGPKKRYPSTFNGEVLVRRPLVSAAELVARADAGKPLDPEDAKRLCFGVSPGFHKTLKVEAAKRGVTIRSLILDALHAFGIRE